MQFNPLAMFPLLSSNLAPRHFIILLLYMVAVVLVWAFTSKKFAIFHYNYTYGRKRIIPTLRVFLLDYKRVILIMLLCALAFFVIYEIYIHWHSVWNVIQKIGYHGEKSMFTMLFVVPIFFGCFSLYYIPCEIIKIIKKKIVKDIGYKTFVSVDTFCLLFTWLLYSCYNPEKDYEIIPYFAPYIFYVTAVVGILVLFFVLIHFIVGRIVEWRNSKKV